MLNIKISDGLRPHLAASSRIAATRGAITFADGPDMNTHSACWAANCLPRGEVPAWYSTGVRCGDGSARWIALSR